MNCDVRVTFKVPEDFTIGEHLATSLGHKNGVSIPMTDPWCWYIYANIKGVSFDGIHGTPYIAAPLGSVMG